MTSRRHFLLSAASALTAMATGEFLESREAWGFGRNTLFTPAVIRHGGDWDARLDGLKNLAWTVAHRTSVRTFPDPQPVTLTAPDLFRHPFLYIGGTREFPPLPAKDVRRLRTYLDMGGFLLADAADGSSGSGFDVSMRREIARIYPDIPLVRMGNDHVAFKSYYLLDHPSGRTDTRPFFMSVTDRNQRTGLVYSQNDLMGALQQNGTGDWSFEVLPGGASQRENAVRTAVNLVMYALCLDYKSDMLHLPFLMKRRK